MPAASWISDIAVNIFRFAMLPMTLTKAFYSFNNFQNHWGRYPMGILCQLRLDDSAINTIVIKYNINIAHVGPFIFYLYCFPV